MHEHWVSEDSIIVVINQTTQISNFRLFENIVNNQLQSTPCLEMLIKLFKKFFALDKSLFNIVMGNLFSRTY